MPASCSKGQRSGAKVEFGYLNNDTDRLKYRGRAWNYIGFDELTLTEKTLVWHLYQAAIAGREVAGIEHADAGLYQGRKVILTPLPQTDATLVQKATDVWAAIGCQVLKMTPEHHDAAFAAVSHLPHLLAFAYFQAIAEQPAARDYLSLAGPGFRDFTRIAASDPHVWRDILLSNREEILKQSEAFRQALEQMERHMRDWNGSALQEQIQAASTARSQWSLGNKPVTGR